MESPLDYLKNPAGNDWLIGYDRHKFSQLATQLYLELSQLLTQGTAPKILLAQSDPIDFLAGFIAACAAGCPVFLCNPNWVEQEWQQVFNLVQPDVVWGDLPVVSPQSLVNSFLPSLYVNNRRSTTDNQLKIMIPTGGSSGQIRFAIHTWETLMASVRGFHQYFGDKSINSFCVLPLYHVSGLMQFLRSFTTGGRMVILPFKALVTGEEYHLDPREFFISLVPTQLARLITSGSSTWLSRFQTVLL
ncbi:MAG TPA: 2-succinylbenzoate-CoA ligase, partial [Cyanobacteria bacterium UBA11049]|nr:2-succinylbenzoate-CoA ligase [Cyanobacteria bacterium UBA11049]